MFLGKLRISITKILLPFFFKIIKFLKASTRTANYLNDKKSRANDSYNFHKEIISLLKDEKLVGMDVGSIGGFNSDGYFPEKYNKFFKTVLIDPFNKTAEESKKNVIKKGLWSSKVEKKLHVLNKRPDSSSMYEPNKDSLHIYGFKKKDFNLFDVSKYETVNCDKLSSSLKELNIENQNVYLLGFSQGAILSWSLGIENSNLIKNIIPLSGFYHSEITDTDLNPKSKLNCFTSHGTYDPVIPIQLATKGINDLIKRNINIVFKEYNSGHEISNENLKDIIHWLNYNKN